MSKEVAQKAILFALRNEDDGYDKNAKLENLGDGAGLTFIGLTEKYDGAYIKNKYGMTISQLANYYKTNKGKALDIIKETYCDLYWLKSFDLINDEKIAIRLFDLMLNRGAGGLRQILSNANYRLETINDNIKNETANVVYKNIINSAEELYRGLKQFNRFGKGWLNRLYRSEYKI